MLSFSLLYSTPRLLSFYDEAMEVVAADLPFLEFVLLHPWLFTKAQAVDVEH